MNILQKCLYYSAKLMMLKNENKRLYYFIPGK